jgi:hypothetical protein
MKFQQALHGKAKGSVPLETLFTHLRLLSPVSCLLSRETVNIDAPGRSGWALIVDQWEFDGEYFDIQFSESAIDFLQIADDPRSEIVAVLFNEIVHDHTGIEGQPK